MFDHCLLHIVQCSNALYSRHTTIGLKHGDTMSPLLYNVSIMDILFSLVNLSSAPTIQEVRVSILLFADGCVILSESGPVLQRGLCALWDYCELNHLKVNMDKTKIMSFKTRKDVKENKLTIMYGDVELEQVDSFIYLRVQITKKGDFHSEQTPMLQKAVRAQFKLSQFSSSLPLETVLWLHAR